jgi:outer membrane lipoprotein-sorting protein
MRPFEISVPLLSFFLFLLFTPSFASEPTAKEILDRIDKMWRGESSFGEVTMEIITAHWQRSLTMDVWSLGKECSLIKITLPIKEKGVATLKVEKNIWNYLPKINRVIKIPSSMMMASWMGSHFTNDDLVKESTFVDDYTYQLSFSGLQSGQFVYEIECIPKPEAAVVWGKVVIVVQKEGLIPLEELYYDEDGKLMRTMTFSDIRSLSGRTIPSIITLVPADKPNELTRIIYNSLQLGVDVDKNFFSLRNLKR